MMHQEYSSCMGPCLFLFVVLGALRTNTERCSEEAEGETEESKGQFYPQLQNEKAYSSVVILFFTADK